MIGTKRFTLEVEGYGDEGYVVRLHRDDTGFILGDLEGDTLREVLDALVEEIVGDADENNRLGLK